MSNTEQQDVTTFAGSRSMRTNYEQGVDKYYADTGGKYRNPHFPGICSAVSKVLDLWLQNHVLYTHPDVSDHVQPSSQEDQQADAEPNQAHGGVAEPSDLHLPALPEPCGSYGEGNTIRVLDLACGAGEASQAITAWWYKVNSTGEAPEMIEYHNTTSSNASDEHSQHSQPADSVSDTAAHTIPESSGQQQPGDTASLGATQQAQHETNQTSHAHTAHDEASQGGHGDQTDTGHASIGGGTESQAVAVRPTYYQPKLRQSAVQLCIDATDPYTGDSFKAWTGRGCEQFSFQDVASGLLTDEGRSYHLVVCSYAMHVLDTSYLFPLLQQLALVAQHLLIISPHKLPRIESHTGWDMTENLVSERVHARLYSSSMLLCYDELTLVPTT